MRFEIDFLIDVRTWEQVQLLGGRYRINTPWVFDKEQDGRVWVVPQQNTLSCYRVVEDF